MKRRLRNSSFLRFAHLKPALWSYDLVPACEDFSSGSKAVSVGNDLKSVISDVMVTL